MAGESAGLVAALPAMEHGGGGIRLWRAAASRAVHGRLQQGTGKLTAMGAEHVLAPAGKSSPVAVRDPAARADVEGAAALLPRHDAVVAAYPPRGAGGRLR